jgi:predicted membrane protein
MKLSAFVFRFAFAGAVGPLLLTIVWWFINSASRHNLSFEIVMEKITLLLWPSSITLLAGAGFSNSEMSKELLFLAMTINVVLYGAIGILVWYGIAKSRLMLLLPITAIGAIWGWLLML